MDAGPRFSPTQEVRFALVMYGGSSLCIYMNGVAQELLSLVRATAPTVAMSAGPTSARPVVSGTEKVYRKIGQLLSYGQAPKPRAAADADITTRFVVDIISGSSAGGINGVFLAKALTNDKSLEQLKELWVKEGDFAELLNDSLSVPKVQGEDKSPLRKPPESLMNSYRMYRKLLDAFDDMGTVAQTYESPLVEELDLAVTTTDLKGLTLPMKLFDSVILEPRYRNVFRLKYRTPLAAGRSRNDFADFNAGLAFVSRCTSSFPFVFEPMTLADIDVVLKVARHDVNEDGSTVATRWDSVYFPDYIRAGDHYRGRSFGDGGDIDNKPFSYAIDSLTVRRSSVPVVRKLVYVEPDPGRYQLGTDATAWVDPITSVLLAGTLPRAESIREDLARVREHNVAAKRVADALETVEVGLRYGMTVRAAARTNATTQDWLEERGAAARARGLSYVMYHRLKVEQAVDRLGTLLAEAAGFDKESDRNRAVRILVRSWVARHYADPFEDPEPQDTRPTEYQFLLDFDVEFRQRRLNFVARRADELVCHSNPRSSALLRLALSQYAPQDEAAFDEAVKDVKTGLNSVYVGLRQFWWVLGHSLLLEIPKVGITPAQLDAILVSQPVQQVLHSVSVRGLASGPVDLAGDPGSGPNPLARDSLSFTALGPRAEGASLQKVDGDPATTQTVAWPSAGIAGEPPRTGLDASSVLVIDLPEAADELTLSVSALAWPPAVQAFGEADAPLSPVVHPVRDDAASGRLTLTAPGMRRVVVRSRTVPISVGSTPEERAAALLEQADLTQGIDALTSLLQVSFEKELRAASAGVRAVLSQEGGASGPVETARNALRFFFEQFDDYDMATLPLLETNGGETAQVDVLRISPYDATSLVPTSRAPTKLAGNQLGHFGAFLSPAWRRNDIMWGRLDAAERLITALLPVGHPQRDLLVKEAQDIILAEELTGPEMTAALEKAVLAGDVPAVPGATEKVREAVTKAVSPDGLRQSIRKGFELPAGPDAEATVRLVSRGTRIIGEMLKAMADAKPGRAATAATPAPARYSTLKLPGRILSRLGQAVWGLVEIAVPGTVKWRVARYWLQLLTFVEVFLIGAGILFNQRGAVRLGWLTLFVTLFVMLAKTVLSEFLRNRTLLLKAMALGALAVVVALAFVGGVRVAGNAHDRVCDLRPDSFLRRATPFTCPIETRVGTPPGS